MQILTFEKGRHPFKPPPTKLQKNLLLFVSCKQPPTLPTCSKISPTHTMRGRDHLLCLFQRASPAPLPYLRCKNPTPLYSSFHK